MPAKSEKQKNFMKLVFAYKNGKLKSTDVSNNVKKAANSMTFKQIHDFIDENLKLTNIMEKLIESEYSISKMKEISNKTFKQVLSENNGVPFDKSELLSFQEKQNNFGGVGKVNFVHKKSTNEISVDVFNDPATKTYVFKKLKNNKSPGLYNYGCFIEIKAADAQEGESKPKIVYTLSSIFDDKDSQKTKVLTDFIDRINSYGL